MELSPPWRPTVNEERETHYQEFVRWPRDDLREALAKALHNQVIACRYTDELEFNACPGPEWHNHQVNQLLRDEFLLAALEAHGEPQEGVIERLDRPGNRADGVRGEPQEGERHG